MGVYSIKAVLQQLNTTHPSGDTDVYYPKTAFADTTKWKGTPIIVANNLSPTETAAHPNHDMISQDIIPDGYRQIGNVTSAWIEDNNLFGELAFTDTTVEVMAKNHNLSLSTGLDAVVRNTNNRAEINSVTPNHVFLFPLRACINCTPNDPSAKVLNNVQDVEKKTAVITLQNLNGSIHIMTDNTDDKTESLFGKIMAKLDNIGKKTEEDKNVDYESGLKTELDILKTKNSEMSAELAKYKKAEAKRQADAQFSSLDNLLNEAQKQDIVKTRAEFDSDPVGFVTRVALNNIANSSKVTKPEGTTTTQDGDPKELDNLEAEKTIKASKIHFME